MLENVLLFQMQSLESFECRKQIFVDVVLACKMACTVVHLTSIMVLWWYFGDETDFVWNAYDAPGLERARQKQRSRMLISYVEFPSLNYLISSSWWWCDKRKSLHLNLVFMKWTKVERPQKKKTAVISDTFSFMGNVLKSYAYRVRWLAILFVFASNILNAFPKAK